MKPLDFPLLSDENIAPDVVVGFRARGCDLRTAWDEQLMGRPDVDVLERATNYLRPGHISAAFVLAVIDALRGSTVEVQPPHGRATGGRPAAHSHNDRLTRSFPEDV